MYKDNNLTALTLKDLLWFFCDFLTSSSGCSIRVSAVYSVKTDSACILFLLTFQVPEEKALTKIRKVPYNIPVCGILMRSKRLSVKRIAIMSGLTNKSLSCTTSNDSTKGHSYPFDGLGESSPGFSHVSLYFQR